MARLNRPMFFCEPRRHFLGDIDGSMLSPGASGGHGQIRALKILIARYPVREKTHDVFDHLTLLVVLGLMLLNIDKRGTLGKLRGKMKEKVVYQPIEPAFGPTR